MSARLAQVNNHLNVPTSSSSFDPFKSTPLAPADVIFELTRKYKADTFEKKVNLGVGAYRDDDGKPWVLPVVKKVKQILQDDPDIDHEYLPITGLKDFTTGAAKLILGSDSPAIKEDRVVSVQTISGTGANHLAATFVARFYEPYRGHGDRPIYVSKPTWANHKPIFANVGLLPGDYPYYDSKTIGLDFDGFVRSLESAPDYSVFLLHAVAHNPTGVDPTPEQWQKISSIFLRKHHFAFFDTAYQGFASGSLDKDAYSVRLFVDQNIPLLVCQSFAKNAGLYGERVGALHVVVGDSEEKKRVESQISVLQRAEISNPPSFGARIVSKILNDPSLFAEWERDINIMAERIIECRIKLYDLLTQKYQTPPPGVSKGWEHIKSQIGMFSFTGLNPKQVEAIVNKAHIYMTANGRISMAGLTSKNLDYVAESIDKAVRGTL